MESSPFSCPNRSCWRRHWHFYQSSIFPAITPLLRASQPPQCMLCTDTRIIFLSTNVISLLKNSSTASLFSQNQDQSPQYNMQDSNLAQLLSSPNASLLLSVYHVSGSFKGWDRKSMFSWSPYLPCLQAHIYTFLNILSSLIHENYLLLS